MDSNSKEDENLSSSDKVISLAFSTVKAIASLHPITGAVASFIFDQLPDVRHKRLQDFLHKLDEGLKNALASIGKLEMDVSAIKPIIESIIYKVLNEPRQQKIDYYRAMLTNEIIGFSGTEATKECMLNMVESLSLLQIHMLLFMSSPYKYLQASGITESSIRGGFEQIFRTVFAGVEIDIIKAEYKKLYDYSLVSTDVAIFSTMTSAQGLRLLEGRMTLYGKMLVAYMTLEVN